MKLQQWTPQLLALRICDDSMTDTSGTVPWGVGNYPGDGRCTIVIDPTAEALPGDPVLVEDETGEVTFRQLVKVGARRMIKPINPAYATTPLARSAKIRGVLLQVSILTDAGLEQQHEERERSKDERTAA